MEIDIPLYQNFRFHFLLDLVFGMASETWITDSVHYRDNKNIRNIENIDKTDVQEWDISFESAPPPPTL